MPAACSESQQESPLSVDVLMAAINASSEKQAADDKALHVGEILKNMGIKSDKLKNKQQQAALLEVLHVRR